MAYNPKIHHRRSIRLKGYDYSQASAYFITICCQRITHRFGHIKNKEMILNEYGAIAYHEWLNLLNRYPNIALDVFQIMPNHMHGIIILKNTDDETTLTNLPLQTDSTTNVSVRAGLAPAPQQEKRQPQGLPTTTVGDMVGAYKSLVTNACLAIYKTKNTTTGKLWQRNYYEHIIRNEQAYYNISEYIIHNPAKWTADKFNLSGELPD